MSSFGQLEALRLQNKDLLQKLRERGERLKGLRCRDAQVSTATEITQSGPKVKAPATARTASVPIATLENSTGPEGTDNLVSTAADYSGYSLKKEGHASSKDAQTQAMKPTVHTSPAVPMVTLTAGQLGQARAALCRPRTQNRELLYGTDRADAVLVRADESQAKPTAHLQEEAASVSDNFCKTSTPSCERVSKWRQGTHLGQRSHLEPVLYTKHLLDQGNDRHRAALKQDAKRPKPILLTPHQERPRKEGGHVTFHSVDEEHTLSTEGLSMQPLLGYDWIAGLLDAESSLTERSEQYFAELRTFRQVNRDDCVHSLYMETEDTEVSSPARQEQDLEYAQDTHQCVHCYRINSRLFPVALEPQAACPVCRKPRSQGPHTIPEPAFIRVSLPRSSLLPAYRYKAHRRCSFDPSDSLGLPSHCLAGWSSTALPAAEKVNGLDLRSSLDTAASADNPLTKPPVKEFLMSRVTGCQRSDELLHLSRLARYHFMCLNQNQAFTQSKGPSPSYPVF
ncbi:uncharacterized protein miip isoform X2 [Lepisosteus oculatus]